MTSADTIQRLLEAAWPEAECELLARDPFEFLVAVICSAQTSDQRVNQVMAFLQEHLDGVDSYAALSLPELEKLLAKLPLFRSKARAISETARIIAHDYQGELPTDEASLRVLPGVGEKTAAVVLGNRLGVPAIAVDSHVARCAQRLGLTSEEKPTKIRQDLQGQFAAKHWAKLCHQFIRLGRAHCRPKRPLCSTCPLAKSCQRVVVENPR
jgi:endonuclease-3